MTRIAAAIVLFATLAVCAPAAADTIPGDQAMTDPVALHEVAMGVAWWQKHGVTGCPSGVAAKVAPELAIKQFTGRFVDDDSVTVEGLGGGCELWITTAVYDIYGTYRRDEHLNRRCRGIAARYVCTSQDTVATMRDAQAYRCSRIRHELGHAIGNLDDDPITDDEDISWAMQGQDVAASYRDCDALARVTWRYRPAHHTSHRDPGARVLAVLSTGH